MELLDPGAFAGLTEAECIAIQRALSAKVEERDRVPLERIRTAAGVDLAYWEEDGRERAVCCVTVVRVKDGTVAEERHAAGEIVFPYLPGCFAFRELPLVLKAAESLTVRPDVFVFDGNGILHPRGMGLASHASFYLNTPAMGVAKNRFRVEGAEEAPLGEAAGSWADIVKEGRVLGRALRTHAGVKPVYVSVGNGMTLDTAAALALRLTGTESRIPLPTRLADLATHQWRKALRERGGGEGD